jgi:hypothetical protein
MWYDRESERDHLDIPISVRVIKEGSKCLCLRQVERDKQICLCELVLRLDPEKLESSHFC